MPDVTIKAVATEDAPADYAVPPAQEIIIKLASASFDGTEAAGSYVPTLELVSPDRDVIGSFPVGNALAAGASADISWFPRGGIGGAGSALVPPSSYSVWGDDGTVPARPGGVGSFGEIPITFADPVTHLPDDSGGSPFPFLDLSDVDGPSPLTPGSYAVTLEIQFFGRFTAGSPAAGDQLHVAGDAPNGTPDNQVDLSIAIGPDVIPNAPGHTITYLLTPTFSIGAGDSFSWILRNGNTYPIAIGWETTVFKLT